MSPRLRLLINRTRQVDRTFSRFPRRLIFPGFGFLALGMIVLSACAAGGGISTLGTVYGIADPDLLTQSAAVQVEQLTAMKAMGATSVRLDANWYWGQPNGPGSFDWRALDRVVASIRKVGLSADMIIDGCPPWAAVPGAQGIFAQPASSTAFATWAGAVAARYGPKGVHYFEIWNEPNILDFWHPKPDPAAYTADLKAAYAAINAVDPSAVVLSGGLAPAENDGINFDPRTFLQDMYADGAKGSFDGLGFHPYSYPDSPDTVASWSGWSMMADTRPSMRSIMAQNGDSRKKIWITEYGAPTSGPNSVGETGQSTDLVEAISQVRKLDWIGSFYIYTWRDISALPADQNGFGLLTDANAEKPAYSSVATALADTG
jgi:polysaccharide biosynthesis protein PslG